ncbi:hypothetical protein [Nesterenkonia jeotgali]|uniref:Uncharacterized protein n=1 Tax=Nesterenkonia jeotgali TaxID=317018 RepID=A0A0W8ICU8_9MICC|nr:hypothetical protein [Nesterenkonia jeotgali]KUG57769.1 hypothetical protein AVL63_04400 [Nesterenkonia jeotgali]
MLAYESLEQIQAYTVGGDPQPTTVVSDSDGYVQEFMTDSQHRVVWVEVDGLRKPLVAYEALEAVNPQIKFSVDPGNDDLGIVEFPAFVLSTDQTSITVPIGA